MNEEIVEMPNVEQWLSDIASRCKKEPKIDPDYPFYAMLED